MAVGERIREIRTERRLTETQLADLLHVTHATISRMETGESKIDADRLPVIAQALGCSPCDFFPPAESLRISTEDETLERLEGSLAAIRHDERRRIIRLIEQMDGLDDSA